LYSGVQFSLELRRFIHQWCVLSICRCKSTSQRLPASLHRYSWVSPICRGPQISSFG